jgi:hypothetical protein
VAEYLLAAGSVGNCVISAGWKHLSLGADATNSVSWTNGKLSLKTPDVAGFSAGASPLDDGNVAVMHIRKERLSGVGRYGVCCRTSILAALEKTQSAIGKAEPHTTKHLMERRLCRRGGFCQN